jgi:hypothetical protein
MTIYFEVVKVLETLQQFIHNMNNVPESVMGSIWEVDAFIAGLVQKHTMQLIGLISRNSDIINKSN